MIHVSIEYKIIAKSGVLVGSTSNALSIGLDKSTIRRRRVSGLPDSRVEVLQPVVPGSAIKGKVRNECERRLASVVGICMAPRPETMCPHAPREKVDKPPCPVCQIFGGPNHKSSLFFSDAIAEADDYLAPYLTKVQAGASLSRGRRTTEDQRLYHIERAKEGLHYCGHIDGYLIDDVAEQQVALVVVSLKNIVAFGGGKSRGSGWSEIEIPKVRIGDRTFGGDALEDLQKRGLKQWRDSE